MIKFSRHAKRRMQLYNISEEDVKLVMDKGERGTSYGGTISITYKVGAKFKYPLKLIGKKEGEKFLLITAYPLRKGRE